MEACGGAHRWVRQLQARGYCVKLIAPQFVKPYVKSNKNDANDAEAICEAMSRPSMLFVTIKTTKAVSMVQWQRFSASCDPPVLVQGNAHTKLRMVSPLYRLDDSVGHLVCHGPFL
jgi:NH3-dependent NAD+ synthetase